MINLRLLSVIWARGNPSKDGNANLFGYHGQDEKYRGGGYEINFVSGEVKTSSGSLLVYWHASLMVFSFAFAMTLGSFVARYLKAYYWWFPLHIILQITGTMGALIAFIIALVMVHGGHFKSLHSIFGIVTLSFAFLSPILGVASHIMWNPERTSIPLFPDKIHCK
jgi:hypothetical protein